MTKISITLKKLIEDVSCYEDSYDIYIDNKFTFSSYELCILTDDEELVQDFSYVFGVYVLKDIIDNLCQQKPDFTTEDAINAMKFYYHNDAFVDLLANK